MDKEVKQIIRQYRLPGLAAVIVDASGIQYIVDGDADRKHNIPVSKNSIFEIASLSKSITAFGILCLYSEGKLSLCDSIETYIPWLHLYYGKPEKNVTDRLTVADLLYHSSGIPFRTIGEYIDRKDGISPVEQVVRKIDGYHLESAPGERYQYVSANYDLLAYLIEVISKMEFADYITEYVLKPLGLTHTYVSQEPESFHSNRVCSYKLYWGRMSEYKGRYHAGNAGSGYILSNITDMARWIQIHMGMLEDIPEYWKKIVDLSHDTGVFPADDELTFYGGGWKITKRPKKIFHTGNNPGASSAMLIRPKNQIGICVLSNINSNAPMNIADMLYDYKMQYPGRLGKKDFIYRNEYMYIGFAAADVFTVLELVYLCMGGKNSAASVLAFLIVFFQIAATGVLRKRKKASFRVLKEWAGKTVMPVLFLLGIEIFLILCYIVDCF